MLMRRLLPLLLLLAVAACDSNESDFERESRRFEDRGGRTTVCPAGLEGCTDTASASSTVLVAYEGRLTDGQVFDSSEATEFPVQGVIPGFRDAIIGMRIGESKTVTIPPELAYGANPPRGSIIPPNATLIFDIELLGVR
jgi:FKBP-type peptidyl-prolyl cis-trans isomerase